MATGNIIALVLSGVMLLITIIERVSKLVNSLTKTEVAASDGAAASATARNHDTRLALVETATAANEQKTRELEAILRERTHTLSNLFSSLDARGQNMEAQYKRLDDHVGRGWHEMGKGLQDVARVLESFRDQLSLSERVSRLEGRDSSITPETPPRQARTTTRR